MESSLCCRLISGDAGALHDRNRKWSRVTGAALYGGVLYQFQGIVGTDSVVDVRYVDIW